MGAVTRILFSLKCGSSRDLETDLGEELFQILGDLLVEPIQLCAALLLKLGVAQHRLEKTRGQRGVNPFVSRKPRRSSTPPGSGGSAECVRLFLTGPWPGASTDRSGENRECIDPSSRPMPRRRGC